MIVKCLATNKETTYKKKRKKRNLVSYVSVADVRGHETRCTFRTWHDTWLLNTLPLLQSTILHKTSNGNMLSKFFLI